MRVAPYIGAAHVYTIFDFDTALIGDLVYFIEGYAKHCIHKNIEDTGRLLRALADAYGAGELVGFFGVCNVTGRVFIVSLADVTALCGTCSVVGYCGR